MKKVFLGIFFSAIFLTAATEDYEIVPALKATTTLPADLLKGEHYTIADPVKNNGYTNTYTIQSKFGSFVAHGNTMLLVRLNEIEALARLKEVSSSEVFAKAAAKQAIKPLEGAAKIAENPVETAKQIPGGIKRKFENIGRFVKKRTADDPAPEEGDSSGGGDVAKAIFGVTAAHRKWAQTVEVDPYSTNLAVQSELDRLAKVDAIASMGVRVAQRKTPVARGIAKVYDLAWGMDPLELQKRNEKRLKEIEIEEKLSQAFFQNTFLTPTQQTMIVEAIYDLPKTANRSEIIRAASTSESEQDAYLYVDSAQMLTNMKRNAREITRFISNPQIPVLYSANHFVAILPADQIYWTKDFAQAFATFQKRHTADLKAAPKELWISGVASQRFRNQCKILGWQLHERIIPMKQGME